MKSIRVQSNSGFLTVDFMFAMIATLGCMMMMLRICTSLVSVQIAQYIAYSAARAHSAGDVDERAQKEAGENKYKKLQGEAGLMAGFLKPGVNFQKKGVIGNFNNIYSPPEGDEGNDENGTPFVGARAELKLPRLGFTVPFLGSTKGDGETFTTFVTAMLFREPSSEECHQFFDSERYQKILTLDGRFSAARQFSSEYVPMEDSGC